MGNRIKQSLLAGLMLAGGAAQASEFTACIVDDSIPNNPVYYYLPTTGSKLRCEIDRPDYHPTLRELSGEGWQIVNILDPKGFPKAGLQFTSLGCDLSSARRWRCHCTHGAPAGGSGAYARKEESVRLLAPWYREAWDDSCVPLRRCPWSESGRC